MRDKAATGAFSQQYLQIAEPHGKTPDHWMIYSATASPTSQPHDANYHPNIHRVYATVTEGVMESRRRDTYSRVSTTRLFRARPSGVSFVSSGWDAP